MMRFNLLRILTLSVLLATVGIGTSPATAQVYVTTQAYDNNRSGENSSERILTPQNVTVKRFGMLFSRQLDGNVNGQVLYVPDYSYYNGVIRNAIIASTTAGSLYAFDADSASNSLPLWHLQFGAQSGRNSCTPVIDEYNGIIYVLTQDAVTSTDTGNIYLHAVNLYNGQELNGSPIQIQAVVPSKTGPLTFNSSVQDCAAGLVLVNGNVYCAFEDAYAGPGSVWQGWVIGYSFANGSGFTQGNVYCTTPNGNGGGITMAGQGIAADSAGNLYFTTGVGTFDAYLGGNDYAMSVIKLTTPNLKIKDYFTPYDEATQSNNNHPMGGSGVTLIPGTQRLFDGDTGFGAAFVLNTSNLGKFTEFGPDKAVQRINNICGNVPAENPVSFSDGTVSYVYVWPKNQPIEQFRYDSTVNSLWPAGVYKYETNGDKGGGLLTVSANGTKNAILWCISNHNIVRAFNASDVSQPELWDSQQDAQRDALNSIGLSQFPVVDNGKLYIPNGTGQIQVYGILP
jgi:hypothetical protein